jgi:hypothetical protein
MTAATAIAMQVQNPIQSNAGTEPSRAELSFADRELRFDCFCPDAGCIADRHLPLLPDFPLLLCCCFQIQGFG